MIGQLNEAALDREHERLAAVRRYSISTPPPDGAFDCVRSLAARFFDVPFASVTILDEERIWFKARQGLDVTEIRAIGGCARRRSCRTSRTSSATA